MTDVRKVLSPLAVPGLTADTNYVKSAESDRPVYYNKCGFLETDLRPLLSTVKESVVTSAAEARLASGSAILSGSYFTAASITLDASVFDFRHVLVRGDMTASRTLTLPTPAALVSYLKTVYGPENVVAGLSWVITFMNDATLGSGFNLTLNVAAPTAPQVYTLYGFNGGGFPKTRDVGPKTTTDLLLVLSNVTPGSEAVTIYAVN